MLEVPTGTILTVEVLEVPTGTILTVAVGLMFLLVPY